MKTCLPIALLWLLAGCFAFGQYSSSQNAKEEPSAEGPSTRDLDPKDWDGEVGEDGKIPELGHVLEVGKEFIQVFVWNNRLRVYFLNEEEQVVEPEVDLVTARLDMRGRDDEFVRLLPEETHLQGNLFIRPPFIFHTVLRVQHTDKDKKDEVYSFMFSQEYFK